VKKKSRKYQLAENRAMIQAFQSINKPLFHLNGTALHTSPILKKQLCQTSMMPYLAYHCTLKNCDNVEMMEGDGTRVVITKHKITKKTLICDCPFGKPITMVVQSYIPLSGEEPVSKHSVIMLAEEHDILKRELEKRGCTWLTRLATVDDADKEGADIARIVQEEMKKKRKR
jgi:hypothetical protein